MKGISDISTSMKREFSNTGFLNDNAPGKYFLQIYPYLKHVGYGNTIPLHYTADMGRIDFFDERASREYFPFGDAFFGPTVLLKSNGEIVYQNGSVLLDDPQTLTFATISPDSLPRKFIGKIVKLANNLRNSEDCKEYELELLQKFYQVRTRRFPNDGKTMREWGRVLRFY